MIIKGPPAGFYPEDKDSLLHMLKNFDNNADISGFKDLFSNLNGIIVPHAGYVYSGQTAAYGFKLAKEYAKNYKRVFIFAPSHYYFFNGVVITKNVFQTPLGLVETDKKICDKLLKNYWAAKEEVVHAKEHSLLVQIPFIQYFIGDLKIIPSVISGNLTFKEWEEIAKDIISSLGEDIKTTLFVVSSDLYHGENYEECIKKDEKTINGILDDSSEVFFEKAKGEDYMACGYLPITLFKIISEKVDFSRKFLLYRTNSNDVMGEIGGYVVGYTSIGFGV